MACCGGGACLRGCANCGGACWTPCCRCCPAWLQRGWPRGVHRLVELLDGVALRCVARPERPDGWQLDATPRQLCVERAARAARTLAVVAAFAAVMLTGAFAALCGCILHP